jgi:hypothetical protein
MTLTGNAHTLIAATDGAITDPLTWVNFGALGLILLSLITGWLWTKPSVDRLTAEKDRAVAEKERADAQRDAMAQVLQEKLLPVVGDFITTTRALLPILQEIQQLQHLAPLLQDLVRQQGDMQRDWPQPSRPPPRRRL